MKPGSFVGEKYRKNRKLITPAFHFQILHKFFKVFNANADILCEKLSNHDGKEAFNIYPYINLYALDNICGKNVALYSIQRRRKI